MAAEGYTTGTYNLQMAVLETCVAENARTFETSLYEAGVNGASWTPAQSDMVYNAEYGMDYVDPFWSKDLFLEYVSPSVTGFANWYGVQTVHDNQLW